MSELNKGVTGIELLYALAVFVPCVLIVGAVVCMYLTLSEQHHKYKRCLTMARWCASECVVNQNTNKRFLTHKSDFRIGHFRKWYKRWLELAEKFRFNEAS